MRQSHGRRRLAATIATTLAIGVWWLLATAASGEETQDAVVALDPDGVQPGSIDLAQTCGDAQTAISGFIGGSPGTPVLLAVHLLELGPPTIGVDGPAPKPAKLTLNCGAADTLGVERLLVLERDPGVAPLRFDIDLELRWDDEQDTLPDYVAGTGRALAQLR